MYVQELDDAFCFLLLPECQPVLSMGQLSDADFYFSWRKINGVKTIRTFNETGTYVECFLQDQCPWLYDATQVKDASESEDSTFKQPASPPLSVGKRSFYPRILSLVASKLSARKTERSLPVTASPGDSSSSGTNLPVDVDRSGDEAGPVQNSVESEEDSGSDHSDAQAEDTATTKDVLSAQLSLSSEEKVAT